MFKKHENRPLWLVVVMQILIRVRYAIESWFFIKPFVTDFSGCTRQYLPKDCPTMPILTQLGFKLLYLVSGTAREYKLIAFTFLQTGIFHLLTYFHKRLCDRAIRELKATGFDFSKAREMPLPEFDWKNESPEVFHENYVKNLHPVVLRGFIKDKKIMDVLTFDNILKKYGEEDVMLTIKEKDGLPGKLKQVNDSNVYLHNSEILFQKYPEILDVLEADKLVPYLKMLPGYCQLFVGKYGTGAPLHCASNYNFFYMVDGKKKWYFVHPSYTAFIGPLFSIGRAAAMGFCLYPDEFEKETFPLCEYCPYFSVTLEPGDVLFNPPWYWHGIRNVTEKTVGIASRWHTDGIAGNRFLMTEENYDIGRFSSFQFFYGLYSYRFLHEILQEPSPRFDEHLTLREKNNRYIDSQKLGAFKPGIVRAGYRFIF